MGRLSFYVKQSNVRHWTPAAVECYKRHCICDGCDIFHERYREECCMKSYVLALYREFGKPKGD